jgi:hypothetical protein
MVEKERDAATAERVARNDATFREANEQISDVAASMELSDEGMLPFICECADMGCTEIVRLTAREYEAVRQSPVLFINARGHERNALGWGRVVDEFDRYTVVEKIGQAGEIVAELDPRGAETE